MKKIIRHLSLVLAFMVQQISMAQSEGLTSSPYSLYGLGTINQTSIGRSNGIGYTGIGIRSEDGINNLNPSHLALIPQNSFYYDIGIVGEFNSYSNAGYEESKNTLNFSNLAFSFRLAERLGLGVSLIPYSDVGYTLLGLVSNIEGSSETFESNVSGLGGLNDLSLNMGYGLTDSFRIGLRGTILFGSIEESEGFDISNSYFQLDEKTNYSGIRIGSGFQFDFSENLTLGSTVQWPTSLSGHLTRTVYKTLDGVEIRVEEDENDTVSDFKLPLELGIGIGARLWGSLMLSADYKHNFWDATEQSESTGTFVDQDIYALGLEYVKNPRGFRYRERIQFRAGVNYDNGYLALNENKVDGYTVTAGLGLPMGSGNRSSMLNISYAYGSKGQIQNILVRENYHTLTVNFSLEDLWFRDRKID
ncbi:OmpP1/FadL family transporter [Flagellimonas aurea]|uniref:OmpP1/FadL family transporter n=1 Tax=Flagellimonas aurea TaxID=2915619 RepID=UPI0035D0B993